MTEFEHIVITRFHVRINESGVLPGDDWIADRLRKFKAYCLPSMLAQSNMDFAWFI